ncbi:MAG: pilus assembly protein, partial [Adlercreutzia sp.]|nr:pilus assembly protein [Adlercreutzia sp.]
IVLYDRMVMAGAAAEGCRLLATSDGDAATCEEYVRRRLGAIPPLDVFHVHDSGCTWEVRCEGGGAADVARVTVRTEVRPLPLLDGGATLLGMVNERGNLVVEVTATAPTRASWAQESLNGASVNGKAGEWRHEG